MIVISLEMSDEPKIVSTSRRFSSKKPEYALKIIDKKREQSHGRDAPDAG